MNLAGINDDLIPKGFISPPPGAPATAEAVKDQNGKPLFPDPAIKAFGNYIPFLAECVVDNTVAVIPGPAEVCARLGIPALEK